ncbi:MAG: ABC transporter permease, partial [Bacteroidetes bacterium]|nr:ABC transporter permease [Bacteroidota bacterium]
ATIVVYRQVDFMQNRQLGFEKGHKLVIDFQFDNRIVARAGTIKQKLALIPGVTRASMSYSVPGTPDNQYPTTIDNSSGEKQQQRADAYCIDGDFINQYQLAIIAGRNFSKNTDTMSTMLVNEAMVKSLGYAKPEDIIGKHFFQLNHEGTIIGVVKDFHFHSFAEKIQPLTMRLNPGFFTFLTIDIAPKNVRSTISRIENTWKNFVPGLPFVYFFADEAYNQQYIAQHRFGRLFICFAAIAIAISCLGLLGLSAYATTQRRKEIGIRKVLGATVSGIAAMLSKDFIKPIIIALLLTSPVSWWLMNNWLQNFAYRTHIPFWIFILSGFAAIVIASLTISFHAIKAALVNPVKSLKE